MGTCISDRLCFVSVFQPRMGEKRHLKFFLCKISLLLKTARNESKCSLRHEEKDIRCIP